MCANLKVLSITTENIKSKEINSALTGKFFNILEFKIVKNSPWANKTENNLQKKPAKMFTAY